MTDAEYFNRRNIKEFRANHGRLGWSFEGAPVLLLDSAGARSGEERVSPMMYLADSDRQLVFASAARSDRNPAWYWDVLAQNAVGIEVGDRQVSVRAEELRGDERDATYAVQSERYPGFAEYQRKTTRRIPVIALPPTEPTL
jgi:deazaflavin-dependent oxidoreductase (nitroreductase family)